MGIKKETGVKTVRKKADYQDRYSIRLQGGKSGLVEATSKMTIQEFRVFATMLTMILPDDEDFCQYKIQANDIIKLFNLKSSGFYYNEIIEAANNLSNRKFIIHEIQDGIEYKTTVPIIDTTSEPISNKEKNHILLRISPLLKPYLLQLKKEYLTIDLRNIEKIISPYSVKIYLVLKHQQKLGNKKVQYEVIKLRQILALENTEYPLYGSFKQQILRKAIEDIEEHTDLHISKFEEGKTGKAITKLTFYIEEKEAQRQKNLKTLKEQRDKGKYKADNEPQDIQYEEIPLSLSQEEDFINTILAKVEKYQITQHTVKGWCALFPQEQITIGVEYVLNELQAGKKITNVAGYIAKMVKTPSLFETKQQEEETKRKKNAEKQQQQHQQQSKEQETKRVQEEYEQSKRELIQQLLADQPTLAANIMQQLRTEAMAEKPPLTVEIAHDNYITGIEGIAPDSKEELLYNYDKGGMFAAYLLDIMEGQQPQFAQMRKQFETQMQGL